MKEFTAMLLCSAAVLLIMLGPVAVVSYSASTSLGLSVGDAWRYILLDCVGYLIARIITFGVLIGLFNIAVHIYYNNKKRKDANSKENCKMLKVMILSSLITIALFIIVANIREVVYSNFVVGGVLFIVNWIIWLIFRDRKHSIRHA